MSTSNTATTDRNSVLAALRTPTCGPIWWAADPPTGEGRAPVASSPDEAREHVAVAVLRGGRRRRRGRRQLLRGRSGGPRDRGHRRGPFHRGLGRRGGGLLRGLGRLLGGLGGTCL